MGARNKLNAAYLNGSLLVAAVVGILTQSWRVFVVAGLMGIGLNLLSGEIQPRGQRRGR